MLPVYTKVYTLYILYIMLYIQHINKIYIHYFHLSHQITENRKKIFLFEFDATMNASISKYTFKGIYVWNGME